jgi:hypothetical protein
VEEKMSIRFLHWVDNYTDTKGKGGGMKCRPETLAHGIPMVSAAIYLEPITTTATALK